MAKKAKTARAKPPRKPLSLWAKLVALAAVVLIGLPVMQAATFRVLPVPVTALMLQRLTEGKGLDVRWRPLDQIAPSLPLAVIAAEDSGFCDHDGFDFDAMEAAARANARHPGKVRGGSTISQQTAKNVFLWPGRTLVRKALEAYDTGLIEAMWGKRRIMEAYLNVVELGPGVYGAEAAAQHYFHVPASRLSPDQSARLAAILPSPLKWKAVHPGRYVAGRSRRIGAGANTVRADDDAWCIAK